MRQPVFKFPTRFGTDRAVHPQKMLRSMKVWIREVEALLYLCSENKGADQSFNFNDLTKVITSLFPLEINDISLVNSTAAFMERCLVLSKILRFS